MIILKTNSLSPLHSRWVGIHPSTSLGGKSSSTKRPAARGGHLRRVRPKESPEVERASGTQASHRRGSSTVGPRRHQPLPVPAGPRGLRSLPPSQPPPATTAPVMALSPEVRRSPDNGEGAIAGPGSPVGSSDGGGPGGNVRRGRMGRD